MDIYPDLYPVTKYWFLGVELFFLISGFVILASALNRSAIEFAISRGTRLYPTLWVAVIFTTGVLFFFHGQYFNMSLVEFVANLTLLNDYMHIGDIDPVFWTLHMELQFYGCVFLLILVGVVQRVYWWLAAWMLLTICYALFKQPFFMPWFLPPAYSAYFMAGCIFYLGGQQGYRAFHWIMLILCLALSMYHVPALTEQFVENEQSFDRWVCAVIILGFYVFMYFVSIGKFNIKTSATIVLLGGLSYPLYLTHHMFGRYLIDRLAPTVNAYVLLLGLSLLAMLIAFVIYMLVDQRLAKSLRRLLTQVLVRRKVIPALVVSE
jgi:peptidoglycan/LPS O-acetylase OafA/YrhL